jgi:oligoendopeptidase F
MKLERKKRQFVDENLVIDAWEVIKPYFEDLLSREISQKSAFDKWLSDRSELEAVLEEDAAWRYIRMTIDTRDEELSNAYSFFITKIQPELAPFDDLLNKKLAASPFFDPNTSVQEKRIFFRSVQTALELFREENIPLEAELSELAQQYGSISAAQTITYKGETLTMQKASLFLKETDEFVRQEVFEKICDRRRQDIEQLDKLYTELILKRQQLAQNAGFANYRDYKFKSLGRFDYTKEDCFQFHKAIREHIVPLVKAIQQEKLNKLGKAQFKPWDLEVDPEGKSPLKPFEGGDQLLEGTLEMFKKLDPYFADCLSTMKSMGHLDLDSKAGKSPGGYNYPLYEIGVPFIFMNSVGAQRDLVTMVHEGGHAVHSFLSRDLELTAYKSVPSEVAELASMSMELLTMPYWDEFYKNPEDLKRAKREQLESILKILPWIAQIDEFQHWIYENPTHSVQERHQKWGELAKSYGTGLTDWSGYEAMLLTGWQRQLHLYEVPFYYIEYAIAQLGALGVWKNALQDQEKAIEQYKNALALGYTRSIPEIYARAGISFDFSEKHLQELAEFVKNELEKL